MRVSIAIALVTIPAACAKHVPPDASTPNVRLESVARNPFADSALFARLCASPRDAVKSSPSDSVRRHCRALDRAARHAERVPGRQSRGGRAIGAWMER